jgi:hypothetical protein
VKIVTPAGETFRVHRRVLPWRRKIREKPEWDFLDALDVPDVDHLGVLGAILLVIGIVIALPVVILALLVVGEVLLLLLLLPLFVLARVALKKPWIVEVTRRRKVVHAEAVVGWGAAGKRVRALAGELRSAARPADAPL